MQNLAVNGYTKQQIINTLHAVNSPRNIKFQYNLLDKNENIKIANLQMVESGSIAMQYMSNIKRTGKFRIKDDDSINWLSDRLQPFFMLQMSDGGWASWSLGIFLLSTPSRKDEKKLIYREVEAYDGLQVVNDDKFSTRYTIAIGVNYITAISTILSGAGITKINIQPSTLNITKTYEWEPGTEKLKAVNDLLGDLNYTPLWVDEVGYYTSNLYQSPSVRPSGYVYANDEISIIAGGVEDIADLFSIPNKWVVVASNAETIPLISTYTNSNPSSSTSTVNRGRVIVDYRTIDNIADQASLDSYVLRIAMEASQFYAQLVFETALMPMHSYNEILQINYSYLNISDRYSEIGWNMDLKVGSKMKHTARKVVQI